MYSFTFFLYVQRKQETSGNDSGKILKLSAANGKTGPNRSKSQ